MLELDIEIKSDEWLHDFPKDGDLEDFTNQTCDKLIPLISELSEFENNSKILSLALSFVSNDEIQQINQKYKNQNKPTNVLSFNNFDHKTIIDTGFKNIVNQHHFLFLGDIVIAYEICKEEAKNQNKPFKNHLTHLILHSILHLIGYDHMIDGSAEEMEAIEIEILRKINIPNPYSNQ